MDTEKSEQTTPSASNPTSHAASLHHGDHPEGRKKDRAPPFVVFLCLFQSFSGCVVLVVLRRVLPPSPSRVPCPVNPVR